MHLDDTISEFLGYFAMAIKENWDKNGMGNRLANEELLIVFKIAQIENKKGWDYTYLHRRVKMAVQYFDANGRKDIAAAIKETLPLPASMAS